MLMADAMEGSTFFPDAVDVDGGGGAGDNLEISVADFFQILDEPGTQNGFFQGIVASDHVDPNVGFQHQADSAAVVEDFVSPWESLKYIAEPDPNVERGKGVHSEPVEISHKLSGIINSSPADNGNLHSYEHDDLKNIFFYPSNYTSEWSPSSGQTSYFAHSVGGSFDTSMPDNFDHHQLLNDVVDCSAPAESAQRLGFIHTHDADFMNDLHFSSEPDKDFKQLGVKGWAVKGYGSNVNTMSSLSVLQNGETVPSHAMLMEKSGSNDEFQSNLNTGFVPDSAVHKGHMHPSSFLYSSMNADAPLSEVDYAEVIPSGATYTTCNVSNSSLSLPRRSAAITDNALRQTSPYPLFQPFVSIKETVDQKMVKREDQLLPSQSTCRRSEMKIAAHKDSLHTLQDAPNLDTDASILEIPSPKLNQSQDMSFKSESSTDSSPIPSSRSPSTFDSICRSTINKSNNLVPDLKTIMLNRKKNTVSKEERKDQVFIPHYKQYDISKAVDGAAHKNPTKNNLIVDDDEDDGDDDDDDDDDVCIIDDTNNTIHPISPSVHTKPRPLLTSQSTGLDGPRYTGLAGMRLKSDDERLTFRIALQGLSQPKTEASPPDGVLSVPLLRHQRIALSWMVQKETASLNCSGGILADDQGLGKTVSTIALILMERSPTPRSSSLTEKHDECEALNLDDDDDDDGGDFDPKLMKHPRNVQSSIMDMPIKRKNHVTVVKHRPAAGTLVVCPTSVLRQWAEELQNKVTSKANLSFLVYHGSNRTKDPNELAKFDVVLTTYAIVSMEVPKQPLVDKDDEDKARLDPSSLSMGNFSSKKRKTSPNTKETTLLESAARPLAKVGWFRVILDEAQSIKNHRTQVARACWGLRAKRRWCLSGTPIQNAVDDLYSYFRFLRYDPYAVYKSFCSTIKVPINRNPTNGYRKLQAVLKTIMLRRTKGTLLDGKPIITLPPKTVTMKKVDFSLEERAFYSTLEAESREQFKEYAAAGTVKQNYVNILLMLLRLRQACDHPRLVKWSDSNSMERASMEIANTLPKDKRTSLLSCLEACLAICAICNDSPDDAVVTICGHVFCNQCISGHLTGDDNVCPSAQCKVRLTVASVFSRGMLKNSLAGVPSLDCSNGDSVGLEGSDKPNLHVDSICSDSSKIKAAIEILQSLPRYSPASNFEGPATQPIESTAPVVHSKDIFDVKHSKVKNESIAERTEKAIVFSQWTRMLDLLEVPLRGSSIKYRRLDGTMSVTAREKAVKDFNTLPEVTVMIMSLKAASLGLNMVAACHVLLLDLWWNPTTEDQAIDRAHRIGQTRPVTVSRLTVKDTVEDRILALQEKKREMVASAFGEDESGSRQTRLTEEDLKYLFMV